MTNALGTAGSGTAVFGASTQTIQAAAVPLPGSFMLLLSAAGAVGALQARRRRRA